MKRHLAAALLLGMSAAASAVNPVICDRYTPDPAPYVYNDTLYLFVDHDGVEDTGYFNMPDWLLYTTTDMVNWTYRGTPVTTATFSSWAKQGNDAWAAQCVERGGKWYWYVTATIEGKGYPGIGVAMADNPAGPYRDPIGRPLAQGWFYIDPTVFIDDDGQAYLFWGNNNLWYAKLSKNMRSIGAITQVNTLDQNAFGPWKGYDDNGNPKTNYEEAPWIYRYGDRYFLEYAAGGVPEHWAYSTATDINGPWTYQGRVMDGPQGSFTIHGGSIDYKGHSYMFYHDGRLPGGGGFKRSTSIEEFTRGADGSLPFIPFTAGGVEQLEDLDPFEWVEAETLSQSSGVLCVGDHTGCYVTNIHRGDLMQVSGADFGSGQAVSFTARVAAEHEGSTIQVRIGGKSGPIAARLKVPATGGLDQWQEITVDLSREVAGTQDVTFAFVGSTDDETLFNFDRWRFNTEEDGIADIAADLPDDSPEYNINGTPYTPGQGPALVVKQGRKIIKK